MRSTNEHIIDLAAFNLHATLRPRSARDIPEYLIDQLLHTRLHIGSGQRTPNESHSAIDIKANAAGRNNTFVDIDSRDATDRKAVALVNVRHGETWANDT